MPFFSILIPSRNRIELLRHAIASVRAQDFRDLEVIIADNGSETPYEHQFSPLGCDFNVRFLRTEKPVSVTENWNRALESAQGQYVIMLGDDDALTPRLLRRLRDLIGHFKQPDLLYMMAYHYAYPGVFDHAPNGYFSIVNNSSLFDGARKPFRLELARARHLGRLAIQFRHHISFNAQHFVVKREYINRSHVKPFYQSPYPDYFAAFVTFLTAKSIVVLPSPEIIIGIARQSFGGYLARDAESEGLAQFFHNDHLPKDTNFNGAQLSYALNFPGSGHIRNWLLASISAAEALHDTQDLPIDLRRYRRLQGFEIAHRAGYLKTYDRLKLREELEYLSPKDKTYITRLLRFFRTIDRIPDLSRPYISQRMSGLLNIYYPPKIFPLEIGEHHSIIDAINWLKSPDEGSSKSRESGGNQSMADEIGSPSYIESSGLNELIVGLRNELSDQKMQVAALRTSIGQLQSENKILQDHIGELFKSTSWRITRPLRAVRRLLGG